MFASFEEKGKIYTQVVTKNPIPVMIQTTTHLIRGSIHIRPDERMKDALDNREISFLAVTDAAVLNDQQQQLFCSKFMTINESQIVWIIPISELDQAGEK